MNEGDVVLTPLPQADGRIKNRPVVVLRAMPPHGDLLVCGVSTRLRQAVGDFDEIVHANDADFSMSGLKAQEQWDPGSQSTGPVDPIAQWAASAACTGSPGR